ncbi:16S rRNA (cytosine(967)-C(5))-methyltransferase RsmB [Marinomonas sp. 15G1-11]|uniref:16S rRNA (cytosine(967)-C(5))-methyltransferase n=1 Tax=Marinomonas phaeophyticola TaxID=3004091 RepID=A0ABT4JUF7_9GAMM|nr:16S rRNA (cytosine(967)-C(5))-methyltransferase RsmB [Marinomonas sp. 15G1-11]MCZ2721860.1 16S rRNA (cytosine(967)-C(5))-methyltransferase RsmB [Marinomonas sp. 15G1-11]
MSDKNKYFSESSVLYLTARAVAITVISGVLQNKGSLSTQLSKHVSRVNSEHQAKLKEICFGVCRWFPKLNSIALSMLQQPFEEEDYDLYAALLIGLYQLEYMDTPDHAAVNEAVEATKELNKDWAGKLINAVLRRYLRERNEIVSAIQSMPSVEYVHPKWFIKRLKKHWPDQLDSIVEANNGHPPMCLRVNERHVSRETAIEILQKEGIDTDMGVYATSSLYLKKPVRVNQLPHFELGYFSVQDESAQLAAFILSPKAGEKVLDACAAPGGKTGHLLEKADIDVTAIELEEWRLDKIHENLDRLQLSANVICADASDLNTWWDGTVFDKILLDAPCSATGVIRRNPDIKINRKPKEVEELTQIQKNILQEVWKTLTPGGQLLYATCSILEEENTLQIAHFLDHHNDVIERDIELPEGCGIKTKHGVQLLPQLEGHDGFYYCLLEKKLDV